MIREWTGVRHAACLLACILSLAACGTVPLEQERIATEPATRPVSQYVDPDHEYRVDVYDPFESFNRGMWRFNAGFDELVFLPLVRVYETVVPDPLQEAVGNFFDNVYEVTTFANSLVQGRLTDAVETAGRFMVNTTLGMGGLIDIATPMGIPKRDEDFGQTLGFYGVGEGPYIVLPLLGPSNLRDTTGLVVDGLAFHELDPLNLDQNSDFTTPYYTTYAIDQRHRVPLRYYQTGSPFEYELVRLLYTEKRRLDIKR